MIFNGMLYLIVGILLLLSFLKDRGKTKKALKKAYKSLLKNLSMMLTMMAFMGIMLTIIDADLISKVFGSESGIYGILLGLGLGSISFMPSFIAFPLGASLLEHGAGIQQVAGFISSLMGVGVISYGVESKYFGKQAALLRNLLALVASLVFVIVIGGVL